MSRRRSATVAAFCVLSSLVAGTIGAKTRALSFEENLGQTSPDVRFLARTADAVLYLTATEAVLALDDLCPAEGRAVLRWRVVADASAHRVEGIEALPGRVNYYLGPDQSRWVEGAPRFARVRYRDVRPGVDLIYRAADGGAFAFDFMVAPGADPTDLRLQFTGADTITIERGDLVIRVAGREVVRQHPPVAYQEREQGLALVTAAYEARGEGIVGIRLGVWDPDRALVIDPTVALYLGGSDAEETTKVFQEFSPQAFVAGWTRSLDFPTRNPVQPALAGGTDAFVARLTPDADDIAEVTYLGGSGDDRIEGIATQFGFGTAMYLVGTTASTDFPITAGSPTYAGGASDAFIAVLSWIGTTPWTLNRSTLLGGAGDDEAHAVVLHQGNRMYVVGSTSSRDFPIVNAWQPMHGGGTWDGFLHSEGGALTTYVGGSGEDSLVDIEGEYASFYHEVVMVGNTSSTDFPTVAPLQSAYGGGTSDAIVAAIANDHSGLVYATYLGGSGRDEAHRVDAIPGTGEAHVAGTTDSPDFPVRNAIQPTLAGGTDAFFAVLTGSGSALRFATYFGGSDDDRGGGIELIGWDAQTDWSIAVGGSTRSADLPTLYAPQPVCASCPVADAFYARLAADGSELLCASYLGGSGDEWGLVDLDLGWPGWVMAGTTDSPDFPFMSPLGATYSGGGDAFTFHFDQFEFTPDNAGNVLHAVKRMAGASIEWSWSSAPRALGHNLRSDLQKGGSFPRLVAAEKTGGLTLTIPMPALDLVFYQLKGVACGGQGP